MWRGGPLVFLSCPPPCFLCCATSTVCPTRSGLLLPCQQNQSTQPLLLRLHSVHIYIYKSHEYLRHSLGHVGCFLVFLFKKRVSEDGRDLWLLLLIQGLGTSQKLKQKSIISHKGFFQRRSRLPQRLSLHLALLVSSPPTSTPSPSPTPSSRRGTTCSKLCQSTRTARDAALEWENTIFAYFFVKYLHTSLWFLQTPIPLSGSSLVWVGLPYLGRLDV